MWSRLECLRLSLSGERPMVRASHREGSSVLLASLPRILALYDKKGSANGAI
jgi:hypothetical protein